MDNYEIAKERIRPEFLKYDQETMIRRFGLDHDGEYLYLDFCGERYRIQRSSGIVEKSAEGTRDFQAGVLPGNYEEVLSIYDILCYSRPEAALTGRWCLVNSLPGVGQNNGLGDHAVQRKAGGVFPQALVQQIVQLHQLVGKVGGHLLGRAGELGLLKNPVHCPKHFRR